MLCVAGLITSLVVPIRLSIKGREELALKVAESSAQAAFLVIFAVFVFAIILITMHPERLFPSR